MNPNILFILIDGTWLKKICYGNGANIDNYETMDQRLLVPGTCFSIEPGIYLNDFGVRTEINVFLAYPEQGGVKVTTVPVQNQILRLL